MSETEPYNYMGQLRDFDHILEELNRENERVAIFITNNSGSLDDLQHAAMEIIPQGINIALSIRELVRLGHLFGALVLMRPLLERIACISILRKKPVYLKK